MGQTGKLKDFVGNLGALLARAERLSGRHYGGLLEPYGLTPAQATMLGVLDSSGEAAIGDLADIWRVKAPVVTPMVSGLVRLGYAERRLDPGDGRRSILVTTELGREVLKKVRGVHRKALRRMTTGLTKEEVGQLEDYLERVIEALDDPEFERSSS